MSWFKRAWRGEAKLWQVFWFPWALGLFLWLLSYLFPFVAEFLWRVASGNAGLVPFVLNMFFSLCVEIWAIVAIWRCAFNVRQQFWGYLARIWVVVAFWMQFTSIAMTYWYAQPSTLSPFLNRAQATVVQGVTAACLAQMTDYANQHQIEPKVYIDKNQTYLQKCIQFRSTNPPSAQ